MTDLAVIKDLKIKTGMVKRIFKDKVFYENEVVMLQKKLDEMRLREGECPYMIKKQEELLNESKTLVPDSTSRLDKARQELSALLEGHSELNDTEEYKKALEAFKETIGTEL